MFNKQSQRLSALALAVSAAAVTVSTPAMADVLPMETFVSRVLTENSEIAYQQLGVDIARENIRVSMGDFDPVLNMSATRTDTYVKNTAAESVQRFNSNEYKAVDDTITMAVEKKTQWGTAFEVSYNIERMDNSLQDQANRDEEVSSYIGVSMTQPLWRNFGTENNTFLLQSARLDAEKADAEVVNRKSLIAREAVHAYLEAQKSAHIMATRKEAVKTAKKLLDDTQELVNNGRLADYDAIDIRAALALRYAEFSVAEQEYLMALHKARRLLPDSGADFDVIKNTLPVPVALTFDLEAALQEAVQQRSDIRNARLQVSKEGIAMAAVENDARPDLNLVVSYGVNGLETSEKDSLDDALDGKYRTWSAGVELTMPLGNTSDSQQRAAMLKQEQAKTALSLLQRQVAVDLSQSYEVALQLETQLQQYKRILDGQFERMQIDREKAKEGKISYMELMRRRDAVNEAQEDYVRKLFDFEKARFDLEYHKGALLSYVSP